MHSQSGTVSARPKARPCVVVPKLPLPWETCRHAYPETCRHAVPAFSKSSLLLPRPTLTASSALAPQDVPVETRLHTYQEICQQLVSENVFSQYIYKTLPTCNHLWVFKKSLCLQMALSGEDGSGGRARVRAGRSGKRCERTFWFKIYQTAATTSCSGNNRSTNDCGPC